MKIRCTGNARSRGEIGKSLRERGATGDNVTHGMPGAGVGLQTISQIPQWQLINDRSRRGRTWQSTTWTQRSVVGLAKEHAYCFTHSQKAPWLSTPYTLQHCLKGHKSCSLMIVLQIPPQSPHHNHTTGRVNGPGSTHSSQWRSERCSETW